MIESKAEPVSKDNMDQSPKQATSKAVTFGKFLLACVAYTALCDAVISRIKQDPNEALANSFARDNSNAVPEQSGFEEIKTLSDEQVLDLFRRQELRTSLHPEQSPEQQRDALETAVYAHFQPLRANTNLHDANLILLGEMHYDGNQKIYERIVKALDRKKLTIFVEEAASYQKPGDHNEDNKYNRFLAKLKGAEHYLDNQNYDLRIVNIDCCRLLKDQHLEHLVSAWILSDIHNLLVTQKPLHDFHLKFLKLKNIPQDSDVIKEYVKELSLQQKEVAALRQAEILKNIEKTLSAEIEADRTAIVIFGNGHFSYKFGESPLNLDSVKDARYYYASMYRTPIEKVQTQCQKPEELLHETDSYYRRCFRWFVSVLIEKYGLKYEITDADVLTYAEKHLKNNQVNKD